MRVVVVDDDPDIRLLLGVSLPLSGIEVVAEAADGRGGIAQVEKERPDGVVLDLRMPGLDGWGALEEIRALFPSTRVVVYTSESGNDAARALDLGASAVVIKGGSHHDLAEALLAEPRPATSLAH